MGTGWSDVTSVFISGSGGGVMKVSFERSGGFTGISRHVSIETDSSSRDVNEKLRQLIESSRFFDMPDRIGTSGHPDGFQYDIFIEDEKRAHRVIMNETSIPGELKPLVKYLLEKI
jgi:hypothetical protein